MLGSRTCVWLQSDHCGVRVVGAVGEPIENEDRLRARVEAELRDQGLPIHIDPEAVHRIAALLGGVDERKRERRLAAIQQRLGELEFRWKPGERQEL
jgi:hypothetical protein